LLRKPDIMIGIVMAAATKPFNINKTVIETETTIEMETEIGIATAGGVTVMMIVIAETATIILMGEAVIMDAAVTETPANTAIKTA
jgi:Mg2+/Co2+ transporter CorB